MHRYQRSDIEVVCSVFFSHLLYIHLLMIKIDSQIILQYNSVGLGHQKRVLLFKPNLSMRTLCFHFWRDASFLTSQNCSP